MAPNDRSRATRTAVGGDGPERGRAAATARAVLLYDRECGFCRSSLELVLAWDRRGRLRPVALQDPEADRAAGRSRSRAAHGLLASRRARRLALLGG